MKPRTISTVIILADPEILDLAYRARDILRALDFCKFDRVSSIAKIINQPKPVTLNLLNELANAGLISTDEDSDPDGKILYGILPTEEDIRL
jgi:hypothetical protein